MSCVFSYLTPNNPIITKDLTNVAQKYHNHISVDKYKYTIMQLDSVFHQSNHKKTNNNSAITLHQCKAPGDITTTSSKSYYLKQQETLYKCYRRLIKHCTNHEEQTDLHVWKMLQWSFKHTVFAHTHTTLGGRRGRPLIIRVGGFILSSSCLYVEVSLQQDTEPQKVPFNSCGERRV